MFIQCVLARLHAALAAIMTVLRTYSYVCTNVRVRVCGTIATVIVIVIVTAQPRLACLDGTYRYATSKATGYSQQQLQLQLELKRHS